MNKIKISTNQTLLLNDVLIEKLQGITHEEFNFYFEAFMQQLRKRKIPVYGSVATKLAGSHYDETSHVTLDYNIYVQSKQYALYKDEWETMQQFQINNCIRVHFEDNPSFFDLAHQKLQVYLYENTIKIKALYTVLHKTDAALLIADLYAEVDDETIS